MALDLLTDRVQVRFAFEGPREVACAGIGAIVVAAVPADDEGDELTLTHRMTGKRLQASPTFPATLGGLQAALAARDALLALPMSWDVEQPDPVGQGCEEPLRAAYLVAGEDARRCWTEARG